MSAKLYKRTTMAGDLSKSGLSVRRQPRPMWWDPSRADHAAEDRRRQHRSNAVSQRQAMQRLSRCRDPVHTFATGRPIVRSSPCATRRPVDQSEPVATGQPVVQPSSSATGQPVVQPSPSATGQPVIQFCPSAKGRCVIKSRPFPTGPPIVQFDTFATGRPVVRYSPSATGRPVIQSDAFNTGRLIIQSDPLATERPVIQPERNHRWPCGGHRGPGRAGGCCAVLGAPPQAPQREQGRDDPCQQDGVWDDKVGQLGISSDDKSKSALLWDEVASCVCSPLCRLPRATPAWADCRKLAGMSH